MKVIKINVSFDNWFNGASGEIVGSLDINRVNDIGFEKAIDEFLVRLKIQILNKVDDDFCNGKVISINEDVVSKFLSSVDLHEKRGDEIIKALLNEAEKNTTWYQMYKANKALREFFIVFSKSLGIEKIVKWLNNKLK